MEPNDDPQLSRLLREWHAPEAPPSLEKRVLGRRSGWWRFLLTGSIRVPAPVAICLALLMMAAAWRWAKPAPAPAPRVVVKTERVEVPVVRDRVVTKLVYKSGPPPVRQSKHGLTFQELQPVAELRPRIIRGENVQN